MMKKLVHDKREENTTVFKIKSKKQSKWIPSDSNGLEIINERGVELSSR